MATKKNSGKTQALRASKQAFDMQKPMEYIMRAFVLLMFVVFPINISSNYTCLQTKIRTYYLGFILAGVCIVFVAFYLLMQGKKINIDLRAFFKTIKPYEYAILAYWVVLFFSALLSPFPETAWTGASERGDGFGMRTLYICTFLIVARFYRPCAKDLLVFCMIAAVVGAYGVCQYYKFDFLNLVVDNRYGIRLYLFSTMSNTNIASTYLSVAFCISYICFVRGIPSRWGFFGTAVVIFYTLLVMNVESGYLGILFAGAFTLACLIKDRFHAARLCLLLCVCMGLIILYDWAWPFALRAAGRSKIIDSNIAGLIPFMPYLMAAFGLAAALFYFLKATPPRISRKAFLIGWPVLLILVLVLAGVMMPVIAEKTNIESLRQLADILHGNLDDRYLSGRIFVWRRALTLIPNRPLIGHGPDAFAAAFLPFQQESMRVMNVWFDKVHSEYIQLLVDVGILGCGLMLLFFALVYWDVRKRMHAPVPMAIGIALLCYLLQAAFNIGMPIADPLIWILWGMLAVCGRMEGDAPSLWEHPQNKRKESR